MAKRTVQKPVTHAAEIAKFLAQSIEGRALRKNVSNSAPQVPGRSESSIPTMSSKVRKALNESAAASGDDGKDVAIRPPKKPTSSKLLVHRRTVDPLGAAVSYGQVRNEAPPPAAAQSIQSPGDLGQMVRRARKTRGLSQQEFADLAGVGRRFLSEFENGKPTLEFGKVIKVALAAGITLIGRPRELLIS